MKIVAFFESFVFPIINMNFDIFCTIFIEKLLILASPSHNRNSIQENKLLEEKKLTIWISSFLLQISGSI